MISTRVGRATAGQNFIIYRNVSGSTLLRGTPVVISSAIVDGVGVTLPAAATLSLFQGIVENDLADGEYDRVQVGGWCDYARVGNHTVNATAIGDVLACVAGQSYLQRIAAGDGRPAFALSLEVIPANGVVTVASRRIQLGGILGV